MQTVRQHVKEQGIVNTGPQIVGSEERNALTPSIMHEYQKNRLTALALRK
jgi:hypothetical protein